MNPLLAVVIYYGIVIIGILAMLRWVEKHAPKAEEPLPTWSLSGDGTTAVSNYFFFEPLATCPLNARVLLRMRHGGAVPGILRTGESIDPSIFSGWAPYPRDRANSK